jgi:hypothetical protein
VDATLNGVLCDGEVSGVWGEDCDGIAWAEGIDGGLVGIGIDLVVGWERVEGGVEVVVDLLDVLVEMFAWKC